MSIQNDISAHQLGGTLALSSLQNGEEFVFPNHPYATMTKRSSTTYKDQAGRVWTTGRHVAIIPR